MKVIFNLDIYEINKEYREKRIKKNKFNNTTKSDLDNEIELLKQENSSTCIKDDEIQKKCLININDKNKSNLNLNSLNDQKAKLNNSNFEEKKIFVEDEKSYSTDCSSIINSTELFNSNSYIKNIEKEEKLKKNLNIASIIDDDERKIEEEMKKINDPDLNDYQKRKIVIRNNRTITDEKKRDLIYKIDIDDINRKFEENLKKRENLIDDLYSYYNKRIELLKQDKSTTDCLSNKKNQNDSNFFDNSNYNNYSFFINNYGNDSSSLVNESTKDSTKLNISENQDNSENNEKNEANQNNIKKEEEKRFNQLRANFYIKHKLSDFPFCEQESNVLIPEKYMIDEKIFGFLYYNDLKTYYITKSGFLGETKNIRTNGEEDSKFNYLLGLYFCEEEIKLENEESKFCKPNNFICKKCMEKNKKKYNIKNKYLINIKGRIAKINKGSYHCFGHFLCGQNIEDCISNFTCKGCELLNFYSNYYQ